MPNFNKTLRILREKKNIPQVNMVPGKNRSYTSRLETGATDIKLNTLELLCDSLGITTTEFISFNESESKINQLLSKYQKCTKSLDDSDLKKKFLTDFSAITSKKDSSLTKIEYNFKYAVIATLSSYWKELPPLTQEQIDTLYSHLLNNTFYGQYDYMLALNISKHFTIPQTEKIIANMFPLECNQYRNELTKQYSELLITNAISLFINNLEYNLALIYINKAKDTIPINNNYYLYLNLNYQENLCQFLSTKDTEFLSKTKDIITLIYQLGDIKTAQILTEECNNLTHYPDYYLKIKQVAEIPINH